MNLTPDPMSALGAREKMTTWITANEVVPLRPQIIRAIYFIAANATNIRERRDETHQQPSSSKKEGAVSGVTARHVPCLPVIHPHVPCFRRA